MGGQNYFMNTMQPTVKLRWREISQEEWEKTSPSIFILGGSWTGEDRHVLEQWWENETGGEWRAVPAE